MPLHLGRGQDMELLDHSGCIPIDGIGSQVGHTGGPPDDKNLLEEPVGHVIGKSLGGMATTVHSLAGGIQCPLVTKVGPGQGGDSPMFENPRAP